MRVTLIDPGCWQLAGHHVPEIECISGELAPFGVNCRALVNRQFPARPGWEGVFRRTTSVPWSSDVAWLAGCGAANLALVEDLMAWDRTFPSGDDVLLVPTASVTMLLGLLTWLERRGRGGWPGRLGLHFHTPPELEGAGATLAAALSEIAFERLRRLRDAGLPSRVTAGNRRLATRLSMLGAGPVTAMRSPSVLSEVAPPDRPATATTLLFIGLPRADKGFRLVVDALDGLLGIGPHLHVRFVLPRVGEADAQRIRSFEGSRVSLIVDPAISTWTFHEEIARASLVLCAYDPVAYRHRTSKIFLEAMALGVPAILTAGMAAEDDFLDSGGIGAVAMAAFHGGALVRAVDKACSRLAQLTADARSLAPVYRDDLCNTPWIAAHTGLGER